MLSTPSPIYSYHTIVAPTLNLKSNLIMYANELCSFCSLKIEMSFGKVAVI